MRSLFDGLALFTNINIGKRDKNIDKFTLCFMPLGSLIAGILICLWYVLGEKLGFDSIIIGAVSMMILILVLGAERLKTVAQGRLGIWSCAVLYVVLMWHLFAYGRGSVYVCVSGVLILVNVMAVFLVYNRENVEEGFYKEILDKANKTVCGIITAVWLMAAVALIQMSGIINFVMIFVTEVFLYIVFSKIIRYKNSVNDVDINLFIVLNEFIIFTEMVIVNIIYRIL